ncbi:MAG: 4Fe-4S dicluster domain-containing protein [Deltaproteobacteria bacterium]|nr:4Fe-4S dicluster domain-containing protein [Deltaproteobacteria bacterium]
MTEDDKVYARLQRHLDSQPVGFPATRSGSDRRLLSHIFTPREAEIAACLTYKLEPLEKVFERAGHLVETPEKLGEVLDRIEKKGGIESKVKAGRKHYCNIPLIVGMFEFQLGRLTPEFLKDFDEYTSDINFGLELLSPSLPQMRTIPIAESIQPKHQASTFDEVALLLQTAAAPYAIFDCICRQKKALAGRTCQLTDRKETCYAVGHMAEAVLRCGIGRGITLDESLSILELNQKEGLVLQPSNTQKAEFICSCCGCCCGMLGMQKRLPRPLDFWSANFYALVDPDACNGCGICEKRCQVGAARVSETIRQSEIDLNRCIGCGVCVPTCPKKALSLQKKRVETRPPQTREELYERIMSQKKGKLAKLTLAGKLVIDALRTGQTHLLR